MTFFHQMQGTLWLSSLPSVSEDSGWFIALTNAVTLDKEKPQSLTGSKCHLELFEAV